MSSVQNLKTALPKVDFNILSLFHTLYQKTKRLAKPEVDFFYSIDSKIPINLHGEKDYFIQILFPLLLNALSYTEEGFISLTAKSLHSKDSGKRVLFMVQDTGPGLTSSTIENFNSKISKNEPQIQIKKGLNIAKALANQVNGDIWVDSKEGYGTTFYFTIELEEAKTDSLGKTALVISNSNLSSLFIEELLKAHQLEVTVSHNINYLNNHYSEFDILILDLQANELYLINYIIDEILKQKHPLLIVIPPLTKEKKQKIRNIHHIHIIEKPISISDFLKEVNVLHYKNRSKTFNIDPLLTKYKDNMDLLIQMIEIFIADTPNKLALLYEEIINKESENAYSLAHSLSNSVGIFKADKAFNLLKDLEFNLRKKQYKIAMSLYTVIKAEVEEILIKLSNLIP